MNGEQRLGESYILHIICCNPADAISDVIISAA